jgi:hypothetical protein
MPPTLTARPRVSGNGGGVGDPDRADTPPPAGQPAAEQRSRRAGDEQHDERQLTGFCSGVQLLLDEQREERAQAEGDDGAADDGE